MKLTFIDGMNSTESVCHVHSILVVVTEDVLGQFPVETRIFAIMVCQKIVHRRQQRAEAAFDKPVFPDIILGATIIDSE
jgi:hypothetical protein